MAKLHGEEVSFPSGSDSIRGYFSVPERDFAGPRVVLVPDVHGLSPLYRQMADRFAARGIGALAVDLYSREGAPRLRDLGEVQRWIAALPDARVLGDLHAAVGWLASSGSRGRVGVTGFCMGGQYALLAACTLRGLSACVSFYGMLRYAETNEHKPESPLAAAARLGCPYLGIFGADDALIPPADVEELHRRLAAASKEFAIVSYPGCGHAFLNHTRPDAYRPEAAADAFERAVGFFQEHLRSPAE